MFEIEGVLKLGPWNANCYFTVFLLIQNAICGLGFLKIISDMTF